MKWSILEISIYSFNLSFKELRMINRNSWAYMVGRGVGRVFLIGIGYLIGKKLWKQKPIDQFPEKPKPKPPASPK